LGNFGDLIVAGWRAGGLLVDQLWEATGFAYKSQVE
jgi:hypothetical protein